MDGALDWAAAGRPAPGQEVSGDLHVVVPFAGGALVAVIDGLGHGGDARAASHAARDALLESPAAAPAELVARCHEALKRYRGAVMSLASFDWPSATMTWIGVGNVEGVLVRPGMSGRQARERLLLWGGVIGHTLPRLRPSSVPLVEGDTLVLCTDGLRSTFVDVLPLGGPEAIADGIVARHASGNDDALAFAGRYRGGAP